MMTTWPPDHRHHELVFTRRGQVGGATGRCACSPLRRDSHQPPSNAATASNTAPPRIHAVSSELPELPERPSPTMPAVPAVPAGGEGTPPLMVVAVQALSSYGLVLRTGAVMSKPWRRDLMTSVLGLWLAGFAIAGAVRWPVTLWSGVVLLSALVSATMTMPVLLDRPAVH